MKTPVTFLPGLMCDQRLWHGIWPLLSPAIAPHHVQFALHQDIQGLASDIGTQNRSLPMNLLGFSMGGYLALHYALNNPGKVARLMIIAASARGLDDEEQKQRRQMLNTLKQNKYTGIGNQRIKQFVHPAHQHDPLVNIIRDMDATLGKDTLIAQLQANSDRPSLLARLHTLEMPVMIVAAADDRIAGLGELQQMAAKIPQGSLRVIADCGHMIPLEAPQSLTREINAFFAGLPL